MTAWKGVGICGGRSSIAQAFIERVRYQPIVWPDCEKAQLWKPESMPLDLPRYLLCTGYLAGKQVNELSERDADDTWRANFLKLAGLCDRIFAANENARVVVIGSESGIAGSHDMAYAGAKAALHLYVETKRLEYPNQMLVALAPHVIWDSGMTRRRSDLEELERRGKNTRLGRWLTAEEVAAEAHHLLYNASPALSGQVIRMRAG